MIKRIINKVISLWVMVGFLLMSLALNAQSINLQNKFTGENLRYDKVISWYDGSKMDDSKIDGVIFVKNNNLYYKLFYTGNLNALFFGMTKDDSSDDSQALQSAINFAIKTSQDLIIPSGRYYIDKTIVIPQHFSYSMKNIKIDFSNSRLILRKDITLFQSDNWDSKLDSKMSNGIIFGNFDIVNEAGNINSYAIKLQDYHQGSKIENASSFNIKNLLYSRNNYYLELYNVNSNFNGNAGKRFLFEGYHGLNKFSKLTASNSDVCYSFEGGMVAALDMQNISVEGCKIGFNFTNEVYNLSLRNSYLENFEVGIVFTNYVHSAIFDSNYVNFLDRKNSYLLQYKGLPANNIIFNRGNTYIGTDASMSNLIRNKEEVYGAGIIFELPNIDVKNYQLLKSNIGKNIKINTLNN